VNSDLPDPAEKGPDPQPCKICPVPVGQLVVEWFRAMNFCAILCFKKFVFLHQKSQIHIFPVFTIYKTEKIVGT